MRRTKYNQSKTNRIVRPNSSQKRFIILYPVIAENCRVKTFKIKNKDFKNKEQRRLSHKNLENYSGKNRNFKRKKKNSK
jgi:hypothetical protein